MAGGCLLAGGPIGDNSPTDQRCRHRLVVQGPDLDPERTNAVQPPVAEVHDVALPGPQDHRPGLHEPVGRRRPGDHLEFYGVLAGVQHHDRQVAS